jgi:hypothetical protein
MLVFFKLIFNLGLKCAKFNLGIIRELIQILQRLSGIDAEWLLSNSVSLYKSSVQENISLTKNISYPDWPS